MPTSIETFIGINAALKGKVFAVDPDQASRFNDTYKALLRYITKIFDHRVHTTIKHKEKSLGMKLLTRPSAPTKKDPGDSTGATTVMDRECEEFIEYQIEIKKYVDRKNKLKDDIKEIFNIVYGQCSPGIQQKLEADSDFKNTKDDAAS